MYECRNKNYFSKIEYIYMNKKHFILLYETNLLSYFVENH